MAVARIWDADNDEWVVIGEGQAHVVDPTEPTNPMDGMLWTNPNETYTDLGIWKDYTPVFTSSGGGGSVGNGAISGRYVQIGKWVRCMVGHTLGSTSNFGSGTLFVSLPVPVKSGGVWTFGGLGHGTCYDASSGQVAEFIVSQQLDEDRVRMGFNGPTAAAEKFLSGTVPNPWSWAAPDNFQFFAEYEAE